MRGTDPCGASGAAASPPFCPDATSAARTAMQPRRLTPARVSTTKAVARLPHGRDIGKSTLVRAGVASGRVNRDASGVTHAQRRSTQAQGRDSFLLCRGRQRRGRDSREPAPASGRTTPTGLRPRVRRDCRPATYLSECCEWRAVRDQDPSRIDRRASEAGERREPAPPVRHRHRETQPTRRSPGQSRALQRPFIVPGPGDRRRR